MKENSIWLENINIRQFDKLDKDITTNVLIIGGGITGILCAYELKKRNIDYVLVEKDRIGKKTSKDTTAFITAQHEILYQDIVNMYDKETAKEYLNINLMAVEEYKKLASIYSFDFKECDSYLYSSVDENIIKKEKEILDELGYETILIDKLPIDMPIKLGIGFKNQGSLNPLKLIKELSINLHIYEQTYIDKLDDNVAYTLDNKKISFNKVIIATHYPIINKSGFYFVKLTQRRSYVVASKYKAFENTYCSIDGNSSIYFKHYNDYIILGGADRDSKVKATQDFVAAAKEILKTNVDYCWSGQDCMTLDGLPYIGRLDRFHKNYFVATGFNLWGFTLAMASSFILADMIENKKENEIFSPTRMLYKKQLMTNLANTLKNLITLRKPRCTHLGCALYHNGIDNTYECPCHGSRFTEDGKVIDGPAKKDIKINK